MFSSHEILEEFVETTTVAYGGDAYHMQCEVGWRRSKDRSLVRWHRWYARPENRKHKCAYDKVYRETYTRPKRVYTEEQQRARVKHDTDRKRAHRALQRSLEPWTDGRVTFGPDAVREALCLVKLGIPQTWVAKVYGVHEGTVCKALRAAKGPEEREAKR